MSRLIFDYDAKKLNSMGKTQCVYRLWVNNLYFYIGCTCKLSDRIHTHSLVLFRMYNYDYTDKYFGSYIKFKPLLETLDTIEVTVEVLSIGLNMSQAFILEHILIAQRRNSPYLLNVGVGKVSNHACDEINEYSIPGLRNIKLKDKYKTGKKILIIE